MTGGLVGCLTEALDRHRHQQLVGTGECTCGTPVQYKDHPAHLAGVVLGELTQARTLTTVKELHDQPVQAVVRAADGDIWQRHTVGWDNLSTDGTGPIKGSKDIALPACLLWLPSWGEQQ